MNARQLTLTCSAVAGFTLVSTTAVSSGCESERRYGAVGDHMARAAYVRRAIYSRPANDLGYRLTRVGHHKAAGHVSASLIPNRDVNKADNTIVRVIRTVTRPN